jgi:hypothetical protein
MNHTSDEPRFIIRRTRWVRPLLMAVGLTRDSNSYVAIEGDSLHLRFGWFFDNSFPLSEVESVGLTRWRWYYGLGWRTNFAGRVGAVAATDGVVEVRFREPQPVKGIVPGVKMPSSRIAISLDEPEAFIATLSRRLPARQ